MFEEFDGEKYYVIHLAWNNGFKDGPRYKELLPNELNGYLE